jgi:hypothetical protein
MADRTDRRCFLARGVLATAGIGAAYGSIEEKVLLAATQDGSARSGPRKTPQTDIPPGSLPWGKIGKVTLSRLILGGNLIGGWAHSRDLMYASKLFTSYNTEAKIFETLELAQACGINTIQVDPQAWGPILKYNRNRATKIQTIVCLPPLADKTKMRDEVELRVQQGATLLYCHGGATDGHFMRGGKTDAIGQMLDLIKAEGLPAGVGSHSLEVPKACRRDKLDPDFFVKTFHIDRYWSATPADQRKEYDWMDRHPDDHDANNDNMWCNNPEETAAYMATVERPWVAFKVMAAGAIRPNVAFTHAFRNGADFVMAGMFDFQVEGDVKIAIESIAKAKNRKRPWRG